MANPAKDLLGQVFGCLTVIARAGSSGGLAKKARWSCRCECGNIVTRESQYLRTDSRRYPRSCGCHHGNETHKMSGTRPYSIWVNMQRRCHDIGDKDWQNYGGRGISVCKRWRESFENFWADMQEGYSPLLTLGRKDNYGNYVRSNCGWETPREQANNRRGNIFIDTPKGRMTVAQAAHEFGLKPITIRKRMGRGDKDLLRPVR